MPTDGLQAILLIVLRAPSGPLDLLNINDVPVPKKIEELSGGERNPQALEQRLK